MLSDCNWVNQAQCIHHTVSPFCLVLLQTACTGMYVFHMIIMPIIFLFPIVWNCDVDHELSKIEQLAPFMVYTGVAGDENACTVVHLL